ncbi:MAG: hypothetical protein ACYC2U_08720 [Candidatus Amoebophilus sp.]
MAPKTTSSNTPKRKVATKRAVSSTAKRTKTTKKIKTTKKNTTAKSSSVKIKPQVRVSRVSVGLGMRSTNKDSVINLKNLAEEPHDTRPTPVAKISMPQSKSAISYVGDDYDEDLAKGELNDEELNDDPVESLGELLEDDERLDYDDEAVARTMKRKLSKMRPEKNLEADSGRIYKRLAVGFVVLVAMTALVAAYFLLVKVKISVSLKNEAITGKLQVNVYDQSVATALPENSLTGLVKKIDLEQNKAFVASGSQIIGEEVSGTMTVYNKYIKNQPLVATTRLLAADGTLFRLRNSVNVPAGGKLEIEVYADKPSPGMVVGAQKFTIPGLWEGLQDKVYAESQEGSITYKKRVKGIISQEDIDRATQEMKDVLITEAKTQVENTYGDFDQRLYQLDESSVVLDIDSKAGEEKEQMVVKIKGSVLAVAFNGIKALSLAKSKASAGLDTDKELADLPASAVSYKLDNVDTTSGTAKLSVDYAGQVSVTSLNDLIDKHKLTGLSSDQLTAYLKSIPEIDTFYISFSPPFVHKVPSLVDRIELVTMNQDIKF